jgi:hypothetical protein
MNQMMENAACGMMNNSNPMTHGAMMAAGGYAAGRALGGPSLLRKPLIMFAAGVVVGYVVFQYRKEIIQAINKATGMGKDFVLQQKETLTDMLAEAKEGEAKKAAPEAAPK